MGKDGKAKTRAAREASTAPIPEPPSNLPPVTPTLRPLAYGVGVVTREDDAQFVGLKIFSELGEFVFFFDPDSTIEMGTKLIEAGQSVKPPVELVLPPSAGAGLVGPDGQPL